MVEENKIEKVWYIEDNELKFGNKVVTKLNYRGIEFAVLKSESEYCYSNLLIKDQDNIYWKLGIAPIKFNEFIKSNLENTTTEYCDDIYNAYIQLDFKKIFEKKINENNYFNKCELKFISKHYPEIYSKAEQSRKIFLEITKEKDEQRKKEIKKANNEKVSIVNEIFENKLAKIKELISSDSEVQIENLDFYKDNKYENGITTQNCILYLAKQYGISIPLATQGFINNRLVSYDFGTGKFAYKITKENKRASEAMHKYIAQIGNEVKKEHKHNIEMLKEKIKSMKGDK